MWNDRDCGPRQYVENTRTVIMGERIVRGTGGGQRVWRTVLVQGKDGGERRPVMDG